MLQEEHSFLVSPGQAGERLDKVLSMQYGDGRSRSFFQKQIKDGGVQVDGQAQKANYRVCAGELVCVQIPKPQEIEILPPCQCCDVPLHRGPFWHYRRPKAWDCAQD